MENILLILNIILAIILVILVLFQTTGIVATLFIICSLSLTIVSRGDLISETSVIDAVEETEDTPKIPDNNN